MSEQEYTEQSGENAMFTSPFGSEQDIRPESVSVSEVRVENGQIKLPLEALGIHDSVLHKPAVQKHLNELKEDPDTYSHSRSVALKVTALAWINRKNKNIADADMKAIVEAAFLHDMGKLDLRSAPQVHKEYEVDPITGKKVYTETGEIVKLHQVNRAITPEERKDIARHAMLSIVRLQERFHVDNPLVLAMIALHHQVQEYPSLSIEDADTILNDLGLMEEDKIKAHSYAQMIEAIDKFDARTTNRPDKAAATPEEAYNYLFQEFTEYGGDKKYVEDIAALYGAERNSSQQKYTSPDSGKVVQ